MEQQQPFEDNVTPREETDALIAAITVSLKELNLLTEAELEQRLEAVPQQCALMLEAIGEFAAKSCGNLNKLYEVTVVPALRERFDERDYDVRHVKHAYGQDLVVTHRRTREDFGIDVKHSVVLAKRRYKANWCVEVSLKTVRTWAKEADPVKRLELVASLFETIQRRMRNGFALFVAHCNAEKVADYMISGNFIAYYCVKKVLKSQGSSVNLGSERCALCQHYHRMQHLVKWAVLLAKRVETDTGGQFDCAHAYFTEAEENQIMEPVSSQCANTTKT